MLRFRSYRRKLQSAFVALGLAAIAATAWEASHGASSALRAATYDRLNAIRETRARQLARYFEDVTAHVLALSSDESTIVALEEFRDSWSALGDTSPGSHRYKKLREHYDKEFGPRAAGEESNIERWFPAEGTTRTAQYHYIAANPHAVRA